MTRTARRDDDTYVAYSQDVARHPQLSPEETSQAARQLCATVRSLTYQLGLLPTLVLSVTAATRQQLQTGAGRPDRFVEGLYARKGGLLPDYDSDREAFTAELRKRLGGIERAWRQCNSDRRGFDPRHELFRELQRVAATLFAGLRLHDEYLDGLLRGWAPRLAEVRRLVVDIESEIRAIGIQGESFQNIVTGRHADPQLLSAVRAYARRHSLPVGKSAVVIDKARQRLDAIATDLWINPGLLIDVAFQVQRLEATRRHSIARLSNANLRLVLSQARIYVGRGIDLMDLVQEGNTGLLRAINRFDPEQGFQFSTYATYWIRQRLSRAVDEGGIIRMPGSKAALRKKAYAVQADLETRGRAATTEAIADRLGATAEDVAEVMNFYSRGLSLDAPIGADDDQSSTFIDFIEDESQDPEDSAEREQVVRAIEKVVAQLDSRSQTVIRMRFGIGMARVHTLEEVKSVFGISRERVRQIEVEAISRLRKLVDPSLMASYLAGS